MALLRGINVGTAKLVPMAKLALCFEELGYRNVKTVLRSGNVVFQAAEVALEADTAARVEAAVLKATGVQSSVVLISGSRFIAIAAANPLLEVATDGSKSFVSFVARMPDDLVRPEASEVAPEVLEIGEEAIFQWMPAGWLKTVVPKSFWKQFDCPVTTRNWNTVNKILAVLR